MPTTGLKRRWSIEPYLGYGTASRLVLSGRVLKDRAPILSAKTDTKWRNLTNTFRRFASGEVSGARVRATFENMEAWGVTDPEGYFNIEIETRSVAHRGPRQHVALTLVEQGAAPGAAVASAEVFVPSPTARFGVISDIDDTVVTTNVTRTVKMLTTVLLSNSHMRTPFAGIVPFYRALEQGAGGGEGNPIFYVSNGPWNLYGLLIEFFKLNDIPMGPIFLRDFGPRLLLPSRSRGVHKLVCIERLIQAYDGLPFVLIGDSGERDPEIYAEVLKRHPDRVRAIYIRSVDKRRERLASIAALADAIRPTRCQFVLAPDSEFAAVHAAGEGLISTDALMKIRSQTQT